jgi:hypothetical protein
MTQAFSDQIKGRRGKKKKSDVSNYFFWELRRFSRGFFIAFLNSPCYETPKNASNKINGRKKRHIFCDDPDGFFGKKTCF